MRLRAWLITAALLGALSPPAWADDERAPPEADARFSEGVALQKQGKHDEARAKYLQALALFRSPATLLNLALLEEEMGRFDDALRHLRAYLTHPKAKADKVAALKREMLPSLMGQTGHIDVKAPPGVPVQLDGKDVGKAPLDELLDVMPGKHVVAASGRSTEVILKGGESKTVDLAPAAVPPTPAPSTSATFTPPPTPPPDSPSNARYFVAGGLAAGAVAGLAVGTWTGLTANKKANEANDLRAANPGACANRGSTPCVDADARASDASKGRLVSVVGFGIGGVFALGSVATLLLWPTTSTAGLAARPLQGGGELSWHGRF